MANYELSFAIYIQNHRWIEEHCISLL